VHLAAPAGLTATPGTGQVSLSWPASVGATSYHVKRARVTGGPYTTVACATTTSYTDTGLTGGTTYYYVVSAAYSAGLNGGGESADSSEASATPQGLARPPVPTALSASPGNGQVALSWSHHQAQPATTLNGRRSAVAPTQPSPARARPATPTRDSPTGPPITMLCQLSIQQVKAGTLPK